MSETDKKKDPPGSGDRVGGVERVGGEERGGRVVTLGPSDTKNWQQID